ncbi:MAG: hypothetical protein WDN46_24025 [Methylocella sp.]
MLRSILALAVAAAALIAAPKEAPAAETCFRACLKAKMTAPDIDDQAIRDLMRGCRDACQNDAEARLKAEGLGDKLAACVPEPVDDADVKKVRSASPSVVAFANAFTWDVNNVLPGKIIRRVEILTQSLSLAEVTLSAGGIVGPGESGTFLISNVTDGYPSMRVTSRIKAIYACSLD